jgi:hypothetical protein
MSNLHDRQLQPIYLPNGGDPEQVNLSSLQQPGMLGGRFYVPSALKGNKEYQLVQVDSTITTLPYNGAIAIWSDKNAFKVTTAVTNRGQVAGVFTFAAGAGNYTCIQLEGRHDSVKIVDSPTAQPDATGKFVIPSATAGKADVLAAGSAATYPPIGRTAGTLNLGDSTCAVDLAVYGEQP